LKWYTDGIFLTLRKSLKYRPTNCMFINLFHVGTFLGSTPVLEWTKKKNHNESNYIKTFFHLFSFIETS